MRRIYLLLILLIFCASFALPAGAQQPPSPLNWIPADFAGFIRIDTENPAATLDTINIDHFIASVLQSSRIMYEGRPEFSNLLPMDALDVEDPSFADLFGQWLGDEIILAYSELDERFESDLPLIIIPTQNSFGAAAGLSTVIQAQDRLTEEVDGTTRIFHGDQATFAFLPATVLIGSEADVNAALAVRAGNAPALTETETYQIVVEALPQNAMVTIFAQGETAGNAINFLLNGNSDTDLVASFGTALAELNRTSLETVIATGGVDAVGAALLPATLLNSTTQANVVLHIPENDLAPSPAFDTDLLNYLPRSAMIVHNGTDSEQAAYASLIGLTLSNFVGFALSAFPFDASTAAESEFLTLPTSDTIQTTIETAIDQLDRTGNFNLERDLLRHLNGSYSVAVLPRPNNFLPIFNTSFEVLLITETDDGESVLEGINTLISALGGEDLLQAETLGEVDTLVWRDETDTPILRLAVVEDTLLVGLGDSVERALDAGSGDNRLTDEPRWQEISVNGLPYWYFDINAIRNTIDPSAGGQTSSQLSYVAITGSTLENNLIQVVLTASLNID